MLRGQLARGHGVPYVDIDAVMTGYAKQPLRLTHGCDEALRLWVRQMDAVDTWRIRTRQRAHRVGTAGASLRIHASRRLSIFPAEQGQRRAVFAKEACTSAVIGACDGDGIDGRIKRSCNACQPGGQTRSLTGSSTIGRVMKTSKARCSAELNPRAVPRPNVFPPLRKLHGIVRILFSSASKRTHGAIDIYDSIRRPIPRYLTRRQFAQTALAGHRIPERSDKENVVRFRPDY
jgi:hypothetical protein